MTWRSHALLAVVLLSLTPAVRAQSTSASISGHISDPTKARIVDAKVAAVNSATNARSETVTNAAGEYSLPSVPPGVYRMEVEKTRLQEAGEA